MRGFEEETEINCGLKMVFHCETKDKERIKRLEEV